MSKLEGRAWEGRSVGYSPNSKGYRVYYGFTQRAVESRNVTFIETPSLDMQTTENVTGGGKYSNESECYVLCFNPDLADGPSIPAVTSDNTYSDFKKSSLLPVWTNDFISPTKLLLPLPGGPTLFPPPDREAQAKASRQVREMQRLEVSPYPAFCIDWVCV